MSWKKTDLSQQKMMFISDWLKQEFYFAELCNRYQISRKTGYKLINRFNLEGTDALQEKSRARHSHPNAMSNEIKTQLISAKQRFPHWGPVKLRDWLELSKPNMNWPAASTVGDFLKLHGFVKPRRKRRKVPAHSAPLSHSKAPNQVWSADFKGQFKMGNQGDYCYPLTISDNYSRYLLLCHGLLSPNTDEVISLFEKAFYEYGLPEVIRTDNGQPFAGLGIGGLTRLSIWWLKLGIIPERIEPGHPEQNGRHERMHRTLKEAIQVPKLSLTQQQNMFNSFMQEYNHERPHDALNKKRPADVFTKSFRELPNKLPELVYPNDFIIRKVRSNGRIKWGGKQYDISKLLYGESVGLEPIDERRAFVHFSRLKLGIIDLTLDKITRY